MSRTQPVAAARSAPAGQLPLSAGGDAYPAFHDDDDADAAFVDRSGWDAHLVLHQRTSASKSS